MPVEEIMPMQRQKWLSLEKSPYYALANPFTGSDSELLTAGKTLLEQGADVLVLDCLGYYQHHRDVLQKALDVPRRRPANPLRQQLRNNIAVALFGKEVEGMGSDYDADIRDFL